MNPAAGSLLEEHGPTGPTLDADDPSYSGTPFAAAIQAVARDRARLDLEKKFLVVERHQAVMSRQEVIDAWEHAVRENEELLRIHDAIMRWYIRRWGFAKFIASILVLTAIAWAVSFVYAHSGLDFVVGCSLVGCAMWGIYVLTRAQHHPRLKAEWQDVRVAAEAESLPPIAPPAPEPAAIAGKFEGA